MWCNFIGTYTISLFLSLFNQNKSKYINLIYSAYNFKMWMCQIIYCTFCFSKWNESTSRKQLILSRCLLQACWMCTVLNVSSWTTWSSCALITLTRSCSSTLWLIIWRPSRRSMWLRGCSGPLYVIKTTRAAWTWLKAVPPAFSPCSMRSASTSHLRERNRKKMKKDNDYVKVSCISFALHSGFEINTSQMHVKIHSGK